MPINQAVNAIFEEFDLPDEVEISTLKKLITGINNNVLPLIIKEFLRLRWAVIKNTHLAYPLSPNHPVNIFCIRLAEVIAEDNEAIIQLLIPTLLERDYVAGSLEALTETEIDGKRCLIPDQAYFLLENNTTLLPLIDWFEYISDPSVPCYFHLYTNNSRQVPLSDQEVSLLRHSCGDLSTTLFKQLEYYRELALSSSSLYGAIKMLTRGLMEGGVGNESNPDLKPLRNRIAGPAATEAAEKFLSLWASIPDSAEKQAISALRVANYTAAYAREFPSRDQFEKYHPSLSDYILLLRYSQGHPLTDEEETHQQAQDLINCVEEISLGLNNIVNAHQAALENFSMAPFQVEVDSLSSAQSESVFEEIKTRVIEHLKHHPAKQEPGSQELNCSHGLYTSMLSQLRNPRPILRLSPRRLYDLLFLQEWYEEANFLPLVRAFSQEIKDGFLLMAIMQSQTQIIPRLIKEGANYCQIHDESNLLTIALENNWHEVLEALIEKNLSLLPEAWEQNLETPLLTALRCGNHADFEAILKNLKRYLSTEKFLDSLIIENAQGENLCSYILRYGSEATVDFLVREEASSIFKHQNTLGKTVLHQAAHCDRKNMLQKFLEVTEPDLLLVPNLYQQTPLESALVSAKTEAVELLMGAYKKNNFSLALPLSTAYRGAVMRKQINLLWRYLLLDENNEIALDYVDNGLALAMNHANLPLICELIRRGANLGALTPHGTVLHYALRNNWPTVLEALFKRSDDDLKNLIKSRTAENKSPTEVAHPDVEQGMLQKFEALAKNQADEDVQCGLAKKIKL